jgi:hypothetical protein
MSTTPLTTNDVLERVKANPNPRGKTWRCRWAQFITWGKKHRLVVDFYALNREAALDSVRNVLMVIGAGTVLGDFATMRWFAALPCACVAFAIWYIDYLRHF